MLLATACRDDAPLPEQRATNTQESSTAPPEASSPSLEARTRIYNPQVPALSVRCVQDGADVVATVPSGHQPIETWDGRVTALFTNGTNHAIEIRTKQGSGIRRVEPGEQAAKTLTRSEDGAVYFACTKADGSSDEVIFVNVPTRP